MFVGQSMLDSSDTIGGVLSEKLERIYLIDRQMFSRMLFVLANTCRCLPGK